MKFQIRNGEAAIVSTRAACSLELHALFSIGAPSCCCTRFAADASLLADLGDLPRVFARLNLRTNFLDLYRLLFHGRGQRCNLFL